jgi:hypothetical protein
MRGQEREHAARRHQVTGQHRVQKLPIRPFEDLQKINQSKYPAG